MLLSAPATAAGPKQRQPLAGTVVRSREYVVRRSPREVEEFIGDVQYRQGDRQVRADWALLDRASGLWRARGDVRASLRLQEGGMLEARGREAWHDTRSRRGGMTGKDGGPPVSIAHAAADSRGRATARSAEWDEASSRATLKGDVRAWGPDGESWSEAADYDHASGSMVLTGRRPVVRRTEARWDGAVQADRIFTRRSGPADAPALGLGRVEADGRVRGWIFFRERDRILRKL